MKDETLKSTSKMFKAMYTLESDIQRKANELVQRARYLSQDLLELANRLQPSLDAEKLDPKIGSYKFGITNSLGVIQGRGTEIDRLCGEVSVLVETRKRMMGVVEELVV